MSIILTPEQLAEAANWIPIKNKHNPLCGKSYEEVLGKLKVHGLYLRYVQVQTPELCMAAVQQHGGALSYAQVQTPEICMAAVQNYGGALLYVRVQTPELCLAAVQQSDFALQFVHDEFIHLFQ